MARTAVVVVALLAVAAFSVGVKRRLLEVAGSTTMLEVGEQSPGFVLSDRNGVQFDLHEVAKRNKVVLINFWATWCAPCRVELPQFEKLYKGKSGRGFEILAISEDDAPAKLTEYLEARPLSFPVLIDADGAVAKAYGVQAFPTSVLIGADGRVLHIVNGLTPNFEQFIEVALARASTDE